MLYGDIAARDYCDLDILLPKRDIAKAIAALLAAGYTTDLPSDPGNGKLISARATKSISHRPVARFRSRSTSRFCRPRMASCWRPASSAAFSSAARSPRCIAADLLLLLCAHGAKHAWSEPALIRDVARLLEVSAHELCWPELLRDAAAIGARRMLLLGLVLAAQADAPVPAEIIARGAARPGRPFVWHLASAQTPPKIPASLSKPASGCATGSPPTPVWPSRPTKRTIRSSPCPPSFPRSTTRCTPSESPASSASAGV
jgi:hypothetical protein